MDDEVSLVTEIVIVTYLIPYSDCIVLTVNLHWWHLPEWVAQSIKKGTEDLNQADVEEGGWEQWSKDTLPLPAAEKTEAQMSENKNPPERKGPNLLISHLCTVKHSLWELKCLIGSRHFHHFVLMPCIPGHLLSQLWPWVCRWDETEGLSRFYVQCFCF